jgi:hypothetical protein
MPKLRVAAPAVALLCLLGVALLPAAAANAAFTSGPVQQWTQVNKAKPTTSYWATDRAVARVGSVDDGLWRSFFQLDVKAINGSVVHGAEFHLPPDRSRPCVPTVVDLWAARSIDPTKPLTWNNSKNYWVGDAPLATAVDPDCSGRLKFSSAALTKLAQQAADGKTGVVTVGLRAHDESAPGTVFRPDDLNLPVGLSTEYNNPPVVTEVNTVRPMACGTAAAPTLVSGAGRFAGRFTDPDRDGGIVRIEVLRADNSIAYAAEAGPMSPGPFFWADVPAGTYTDGEVYHFHAQARDDLDTGPSTRDCYFTIDSVDPGLATISSTDFPDGERVTMARTTGTLTLHAPAGDTDVVSFRWDFQAERMANRIDAGPDGTAVLPLTVAGDRARLYVQAVDRAGNLGPVTDSWSLEALPNPNPPSHVRGDVTGDGRPDVTMALDNGDVWTFVAKDGGFHRGTDGFDYDLPGSPGPVPGPFARGDFNGDGTTDAAYVRGDHLTLLASDGNGYGAFPMADVPKPDRIIGGDFTGDGKADVALQYPDHVSVLSNGTLTTWLPGGAGELVAGDFDGDGKADLATLTGGKLTFHHSTGTAFETGVTVGANRVSSAVAGDVDGDGKDDVIALADRGVTVFGSAAGFAARTWSTSGVGPAVLGTGDFNLDGKADLAVLRGSGTTELWTLSSTGSGFGDAVLGGREQTGGTPVSVGT